MKYFEKLTIINNLRMTSTWFSFPSKEHFLPHTHQKKRACPWEWQEEMAADVHFFHSVLLFLHIYRNRTLLLIRVSALLKCVFGTCVFLKELTCFWSKKKYKTSLDKTPSSKQILTLYLICSSISQRNCLQAKFLKTRFEPTYITIACNCWIF